MKIEFRCGVVFLLSTVCYCCYCPFHCPCDKAGLPYICLSLLSPSSFFRSPILRRRKFV